MTTLNNKLIQLVTRITLSPQMIAKLPMLANILIVTFLAIELADLTWSLLAEEKLPATNKTLIPKVVSNRQPVASLANIPMLHLLGISEKDATKNLSKGPINAPDTQLRLELRGVFAAELASHSMAIIASKGGKDKTYIIGDSVPGGASLHEVYKDRVILSRNGKLEALRLKTPQADITVTKNSAPSYVPGSGAKIHRSDRIKQFKTNYKKDPQSLWKQVRISPVTKNGVIEGYNFSHNDRMLMKDLGIQENDIITAINGTQVSDNAALFGMMKDIPNMTQLELTVRRNNTVETVQINFD